MKIISKYYEEPIELKGNEILAIEVDDKIIELWLYTDNGVLILSSHRTVEKAEKIYEKILKAVAMGKEVFKL